MNSLWEMQTVVDVSDDLKPDLLAHIKQVEHLVPRWIETIRLYYKPRPGASETDANASIDISLEYRNATLNLLPPWVDQTPEQRHHTLVHELAHLATAQLYTLTKDVIEKLVKDDGLKALLLEQARVAMEGATEDITGMILRTEQRAHDGG